MVPRITDPTATPGATGCTPIPVYPITANPDPSTMYAQGPYFTTASGVTTGAYVWHNIVVPSGVPVTLLWGAWLALPNLAPIAETAPEVRDAGWCRTPLDRFILAKLEAKGLTPNPALDRRKLIRRVAFDLTGLPPTPEEVSAFVHDPSPDAYGRLVERLLASPPVPTKTRRWKCPAAKARRYSSSRS